MSDPGFVADVMASGSEDAKRLLQRLAFYTHAGYRREVGYVHSAKLYGHADYRGKVHALTGPTNIRDGVGFDAVCGHRVYADHDGESFNIWPASDQEGTGITCRRCRAAIRKSRK